MQQKVRVIKNVVLIGLGLALILPAVLISELKMRHVATLILFGLSLFLVISAFLIQDMFYSLWKIPIAFVMLLAANAIFQRALINNKERQ